MTLFPREPPPQTGASNAGGVGRNRNSEPISGFTAVNTATGHKYDAVRPRQVSCGTSLLATASVC